MAKNVTQKDIEYLDGAIAKQTYRLHYEGFIRHGEYGSARFERIKELGLIEHAKIDGTDRYGWKPTEAGNALIAPMVEKRKQELADRKERETAFWEKQLQMENAFKAELQSIGVTLFTLARASEEWRIPERAYVMEYRIEFPITCHVEYNRHDNRYFVRAAVGHSGECDTAALIAEAQQAQIACDYLNAKLKGE